MNFEKEKLRLARKKLELKGVSSGPDVEALAAKESKLQAEYDRLLAELQAVRSRVTAVLVLETAGGQEKELPLVQVVRADRPNEMGWFAKAGRYAANVWAFVSEDPRESNTEGGVFPAIFGTVLMVLIMSIVVTPLGVLTAFYLREYAKQGPVVSAVRIAVNNLAGVPVDRLRRLRPRLLHLLRRRVDRPRSSSPRRCRRRPGARAESSGPR